MNLGVAASRLLDAFDKAFADAGRPFRTVYLSDSSVPVLAGEELCVSFDGLTPGFPGGGVPTGDQFFPAEGGWRARFSVWAARESVVPDNIFDGYQPDPAELEPVARGAMADAMLLLDVALGLAPVLGECNAFHVVGVTPLVAQGGIVGHVVRIDLSTLGEAS